MIDLSPEEKIILSSNDDSLILTNFRLIYKKNEGVSSFKQIIPLEQISSVEYIISNQFVLLILSIVTIFLAIIMVSNSNESAGGFFLLMGIFGICIYYFMRKKQIIISSSNTKMIIKVDDLKIEQIENFTSKVERQKNIRLQELRK